MPRVLRPVLGAAALLLACATLAVAAKQLSGNGLAVPEVHSSLALRKALTHSSHLASRRHGHRHNGHQHRHSRHGTIAFGSLFATYLATVEIDDQSYICILDTGSSDFAVAASPDCGCDIYYSGEGCHANDDEDAVHLRVQYGDGNWTGVPCTDKVSIGDMSLGTVTFAGMFEQTEMLECDANHQQNGIIGLAFPGLLGPPTNYSEPFFDLLAKENSLPKVFGLQCCGWMNDSSREYSMEYAEGALDLGGANKQHYDGDFFYTPITERLFYAVDLIDVRVNGVSVMPQYRRPANALYRNKLTQNKHSEEGVDINENTLSWPQLQFSKQTIVDSGTSNIIFVSELWNATIEEMKKYVSQPDSVWQGEDCLEHSDDGSDVTATWPTLSLVLASSDGDEPFTLHIPPCRYLPKAPAKECSNGKDGHAFSIELEEEDGNILGQVVYESFYVVHDMDSNRVGFAKLDGCHNDRTCLNAVRLERDTQLVRAHIVNSNSLVTHWWLLAICISVFIAWIYRRRTHRVDQTLGQWSRGKEQYELIEDESDGEQ